MTAKF